MSCSPRYFDECGAGVAQAVDGLFASKDLAGVLSGVRREDDEYWALEGCAEIGATQVVRPEIEFGIAAEGDKRANGSHADRWREGAVGKIQSLALAASNGGESSFPFVRDVAEGAVRELDGFVLELVYHFGSEKKHAVASSLGDLFVGGIDAGAGVEDLLHFGSSGCLYKFRLRMTKDAVPVERSPGLFR